MKQRYPNLRLTYLSSRIYGGYAGGMLNPEPYAYEGAFTMRWLIQDEFSSAMVFFHEVAIPPGVVEGTHQHIGSEELYFIYQGEGIAYMGAADHPDLAQYPEEQRHVFGLDPKPGPCDLRQLREPRGELVAQTG